MPAAWTMNGQIFQAARVSLRIKLQSRRCPSWTAQSFMSTLDHLSHCSVFSPQDSMPQGNTFYQSFAFHLCRSTLSYIMHKVLDLMPISFCSVSFKALLWMLNTRAYNKRRVFRLTSALIENRTPLISSCLVISTHDQILFFSFICWSIATTFTLTWKLFKVYMHTWVSVIHISGERFPRVFCRGNLYRKFLAYIQCAMWNIAHLFNI